MPADQHDAPPLYPPEAEEALRWAIVSRMRSNGTARSRGGLAALRTLPAAARWRLIAWLARGLEPTRGMVDAGMSAYRANGHEPRLAPTLPSIITAALAAAAEAGDGE